jgi:hypothetical protein
MTRMERKIPAAALKWFRHWNTGVSSLTIWSAMTGCPVQRYDIPYDPDDFSRCYTLLQLVPRWRSRLHLVSRLCPKWKPFVAAWDELTTLYEEESPKRTCPKLYARMRELRGEKPIV